MCCIVHRRPITNEKLLEKTGRIISKRSMNVRGHRRPTNEKLLEKPVEYCCHRVARVPVVHPFLFNRTISIKFRACLWNMIHI